jgi:hypothetical protein
MQIRHISRRAGLSRLAAYSAIPAALLSFGCSRGVPSQLEHFPMDLQSAQVEASGIYPDSWVAPVASANLYQPSGEQTLTIRGLVPRVTATEFETEIVLSVDGVEVGRRRIGLGDFELSAPVARGPGKRRVSIAFGASQQLPADGRAVGAQLRFFGFESATKAGTQAAPDIVRGAVLKLGSGWGELETFNRDHFRWVENDAQIMISPAKSGDVELSLTAEAGPGTGGQCLLKVLDRSGRQVAAATLGSKQTVKMFLPTEGGTVNEYRLHVDGGGKRIATDPRILNFRVFDAAVAPVAH